MKNVLLVTVLAAVASPALATAAPLRVDTNGEFYVGGLAPGVQPVVPNGWTQFDNGAGGGQGTQFNTGSSSDALCASYEAEPNWVSESGHGRILGGSSAGGQYGVSQTLNATPNKVYMMMGVVRRANSTADANARFGIGLANGAGWAMNYSVADSKVGRSTSSGNQMIRSTQYWHAVAATGSQVTAAIGSTSTAAIGGGRNTWYDGIRVYEFDTTPNTALLNGDFNAAGIDLTGYKAKGSEESGRRGFYAPDGWFPIGGGIGSPGRIDVNTGPSRTDNALQIDYYNSVGRGYWGQRVKLGPAGTLYTLTGDIYAFASASNAVIGIDPTGGLDPTAASVVWSSPIATFNAWQNGITVANVAGGANGVTVFVASGSGTDIGTTSGAWFDNIVLTPEPAAILLLGLPLLVTRRRCHA